MLDTEVYKILFSLVITATIMTIFEIIFAYLIVFPSLKPVINSAISNLPKADTLDDSNIQYLRDVVLLEVQAFVRTGRDREKRLVEKINLHTKIFASFLVGFMVFLTVALRTKIIHRENTMSFAPYVLAGITVSVLITFQLAFYVMTNKNARPKIKFIKNLPSWTFSNPEVHIKYEIESACQNYSKEKLKDKQREIKNALYKDSVREMVDESPTLLNYLPV